MTTMRPSRRRPRAFTLVELVAVMVVIGTIGGVVAGIVQRLAEANNQTAVRSQLYNEATMALDRIVNMVKFTPVRGTGTQTPAISAITPSSITWENGDTLALTGGNLNLCSVRDGDAAATPKLLLANVSAFTIAPINDTDANLFTAYATISLNAVQSGDAHAMNLSLTLTRANVSATLSTRVFLRANAELAAP